jgi:phenylalanyl-tRNA synthetase beta chain
MPTISVDKMNLMRDLNRNYCKKLSYKTDISAQEDFFNLCFEYGIELEEIVGFYWEKQLTKQTKNDDEREVYKIDIPANRYDMLCPEGISNALDIYVNNAKTPNYRVLDVVPQEIHVTKNVRIPFSSAFSVFCISTPYNLLQPGL